MIGQRSNRPLRKYFIQIAVLLLVLVVLTAAGNYSNFIERYYTHGLYVPISFVLHHLLSWLPLSMGDVFYTVIIILLVRQLIRIVKQVFKKQFAEFKRSLLSLVAGTLMFIVCFYLFWGMNYSRPPAAHILGLTDSTYTIYELKQVTTLLIDSTNARRALIRPADTLKNNAALYQTAAQAIRKAGEQNIQLTSYAPAAKSSLFTPLINYFSTGGYFNPFTGEAQINAQMPMVNRPFTACHEMAHQMGFAREDEANFVGFLAAKESPDALLRYSAYYMAMDEFMRNLYRRDSISFKQLKLRISPAVITDLKADRAYWTKYQNQISVVSSLFYDNFLKLNKQPMGLRTYNRMIILTMAYYKGVHRE